MKWKWYHAVRLKKLADFLHQLPKEKFDFKDWVTTQKNGCGTICCALGWMPKVDKRWKWISISQAPYRLIPYCETTAFPSSVYYEQAQEYFGITPSEYCCLFISDYQNYIEYKDFSDPTPKQVARMYYRFIAKKEKIRLANKK